jgi:large subunit ribosomal protein L15
MRLHDLRPAAGAAQERTRVGRGHGSGKGKTGGYGTKGQLARSGRAKPPYFEGGQLPLSRKLPYRRGFTNPFRVDYAEVNLRDLAAFPAGATVTPDDLRARGLLRGAAKKRPVKVLGTGDLAVRLTVRADRFSAAARAKIEAAGGTAELLQPEPSPPEES